ncbi:MAG: ADP-forming succinate--CoA ligase subunit beta [Chloroflexi bacterium]|nr:ADP-forming succinate--CoA ligase subunit beta [Chloroflexota bacterium]
MKIHEYQAREILAKHGVPVPRAEVATSPAEARAVAERLGGSVVVKAQVLVGGRGKAGGVKLAAGPAEAEEIAGRILGMDLKGITVRRVLVAEAVNIQKELYLGVTIDRSRQAVVAMGSAEGGVEIEEVARTAPDKIIKVYAHPMLGFADFHARQLAYGMGLAPSFASDFTRIMRGLYNAMVATDASLVEINPLVIVDGKLLAIDSKILLDDNALYRHKDLEALRDLDEDDPYERAAREEGLNFVKLDGNIGCVVNGAGLAMATMDVVKLYGGDPANFLDIGGGARAESVAAALKIILSDPKVEAVLFNIFGGITRCDEVAKGIVAAQGQLERKVPMVVRLLGTNEEEARRILAEASLISATTMEEAAQKVVAQLKQG